MQASKKPADEERREKKANAQRSAATYAHVVVLAQGSDILKQPRFHSDTRICTSVVSPVIVIRNPLRELCNTIRAPKYNFPSDVSKQLSNKLIGVSHLAPTLESSIASIDTHKRLDSHRLAR
jgi:hypothetical protein